MSKYGDSGPVVEFCPSDTVHVTCTYAYDTRDKSGGDVGGIGLGVPRCSLGPEM